MMITKNELKYYSSLLLKKNRDAENKFIAEGKKIVGEAIGSNFNCEVIFVTSSFAENETELLEEISAKKINAIVVKNNEIEKLSDTVTPQGIAGVFIKPENPSIKSYDSRTPLVVYLENIADPGNMGTIIRNCDWFGITEIILSKDCVDIFNPKVIRGSMGSVFHIKFYKEQENKDILHLLKKQNYSILSADTDGKDIRILKKPEKSVLVLANESNGPSNEVISLTDIKVQLPAGVKRNL